MQDIIDIDMLPELETVVAIAGSALREEVGGSVCYGVAVAIATYGSEGG